MNLHQLFDHLWNHPAQGAWAIFAALTAFTMAFSRAERSLANFVLKSQSRVDNRVFRAFAHVMHQLMRVLKVVSFFAPRFASRVIPTPSASIPPEADKTPVTTPETPKAISDKPKPH